MRMLAIGALFMLAFSGTVYATIDDLGTIVGTVLDAEGKPVEGATVILTSDPSSSVATSVTQAATLQTTSGREGSYRFAGLRPGKYRVAAEMNGYAPTASTAIEVTSAATSVKVGFKLVPQSSAAEPRPPPTTSAESRPHLKLEAAGVRGLIDPGGYSASANASAASGLVEGIADIKRAGNNNSALTAKDWPCGIEPELKKSVAANPDQSAANRKLGEFYVAHNLPAKAIPFLLKAREFDLADDVAARDLAVAWMKNGQFDPARELLSKLTEKQPSPETHRLLARAEEGSGRFSQASQQYQLAAHDEPTEENLFGVGYELILAGLPVDAGNAFQLGLKQHTHSIKLLIGAGTAEFLQGHTSEGLLSFLQASDLDPSDPRPYSFLASASGISRGESEKVHNAFKRFLALAPDNAEASYFYAVSLLNGNAASAAADFGTIESLLKRAVALDPWLARAHLQLGILDGNRGDYQAAAIEYEDTIRLAPGIKEAHYRLAGAYRRTGRSELAAREMQLFQQARERETSNTGDSNVGIEQFVSVIDKPGPQSGETAPCPEETP